VIFELGKDFYWNNVGTKFLKHLRIKMILSGICFHSLLLIVKIEISIADAIDH
jgi:hypothetical protein